MNKIRLGNIEIFGILGMVIWGAVVLLRESSFSGNGTYIFFRGILPNLGAAWAATMFGAWLIQYICKRKYTIKRHVLACLSVLALAIISEVIHHFFLNSPFDIHDILTTILAQTLILIIPIAIKDKVFDEQGSNTNILMSEILEISEEYDLIDQKTGELFDEKGIKNMVDNEAHLDEFVDSWKNRVIELYNDTEDKQ